MFLGEKKGTLTRVERGIVQSIHIIEHIPDFALSTANSISLDNKQISPISILLRVSANSIHERLPNKIDLLTPTDGLI